MKFVAVVCLLVVLLVAVLREVLLFYQPFNICAKKHICFLEPVDWSILRQPALYPLVNYDANYYYEYISYAVRLTEWCAFIGDEVSKKCNVRFNSVTAIYCFRCKHQKVFSGFTFTGPPVKHCLVVVPLDDEKNAIKWKGATNTFKQSVVITPFDNNTSIEVSGRWFLLAIVQPLSTWDC